GLFHADKGGGDSGLHLLAPATYVDTDDSAYMISLYFQSVIYQHGVCKRSYVGKGSVKYDDKIILKIIRHSTAIASRITDDFVLSGHHFDIGAFIKCIDNYIGAVGLRKRKAEPGCSFRRRKLCCDVIIGQVDAVIMRLGYFGFVGKPAGTFVFIKRSLACYGHEGKLTVVVHPRRRLMRLLKPTDFVGGVGIHPAISHFSGLRRPKIHAPR